jgi:hypothetical protein
VRISRDVSVQQNPAGELVVISRTPAVVDEELTLTLTSRAGRFDMRVLVVESVPVVIDGSVRHQLRVRSAA